MIFIQECINKIKNEQEMLLDYFEDSNSNEFDFENLINYIEERNIFESKCELKSLLYLISKILDNHQRSNDLCKKALKVLIVIQEEIKKYLSNMEIFNIFKRNKLILLSLLEEGMLIPTKIISSIISKGKYKENFYPQYFYPEFKVFFGPNENLNDDDIEFNKKRKNGVNDNYICQLIQKDSIKEFIIYMNKKNLSTKSIIKPSIFETNLFLLKNKESSLIEYAAFYGSIQIFQYLLLNNARLTNSLWLYAIHGRNSEIIHILEDNKVKMPNDSFHLCFKEAVKCHHIDLMNYFKNIFCMNENNIYPFRFKFYNFSDLEENVNYFNELFRDSYCDDSLESQIFYYLCKSDYLNIVNFLVKNAKVNLNAKKVLKSYIF